MPAPHVPPPGLPDLLGRDAAPWREFEGARLFITGGTGFLGCNLLEALFYLNDTLGLDLSLTVLTRDPPAFAKKAPRLAAHPALTLWPGDVTDFPPPPATFTHLIHGAAPAASAQSRQGDEVTLAHSRAATARVLDFARRSEATHLLYLSSGAVYGANAFADGKPAAETAPLRPTTAYGQAKAEAENALRAATARSGPGLAIARAFTFLGPWQDLDAGFAVTDFIRAARAGQSIVLHGPPSTVRSYLYAPEAAVHLLRLLTLPARETTCNVGSPQPVTMRELAEAVRTAFAPQVAIEERPSPQPATAYLPDCARAESLGLRATVSLPEALHLSRAFLSDL
jgi:nucleoside-diphosphate-sugar epimerase